MTRVEALAQAQAAFGPVVRETGHGWWMFTTTAPHARLSASRDRADTLRCRKREVIRHALVLLGWPNRLARAYADQLHPSHSPLFLLSDAERWRSELDGCDDRTFEALGAAEGAA